jgi:hypothetical protein
MKNLTQKHSETQYLLVSVDWILSALSAWFKQVDEYAKNFCFLRFQEIQRSKKKTIETRCIQLHTALSDGDSHNINNVGFSPNLRFYEKSFLEEIGRAL